MFPCQPPPWQVTVLEKMEYRIVDLGKDYPGRIDDFAKARNSFLHDGWVLFIDSDEEVPRGLLRVLDQLDPKEPYYWIRRVNLYKGRYVPGWNPDFKPALVSSRVSFFGRIHERVTPKDPHGTIDIPLIHNHNGPWAYRNYWYQNLPFYRLWLASKKIVEVARGR